METIVPRSLILDRARRAVESGQSVHQFNAWPPGTAAGQAFLREVEALQAQRAASERALDGVCGRVLARVQATSEELARVQAQGASQAAAVMSRARAALEA